MGKHAKKSGDLAKAVGKLHVKVRTLPTAAPYC
jgi:hypothetical protein